jgi:hypothetical protein
MGELMDVTDARAFEFRDAAELRRQVDEVVSATPVLDMHTHLFPPQFGGLNLYGIDSFAQQNDSGPRCWIGPKSRAQYQAPILFRWAKLRAPALTFQITA